MLQPAIPPPMITTRAWSFTRLPASAPDADDRSILPARAQTVNARAKVRRRTRYPSAGATTRRRRHAQTRTGMTRYTTATAISPAAIGRWRKMT